MQANPFLGNGMTAKLLDPGRVPEGAAALWPQLQELPYTPRCDSAGELDTRHGWTTALAEGYANRVLDRISGHAPDLRRKIRMIDVLTPHDLEARNPNAFNGDPYGGSTELDQNLLWRPLASPGPPRDSGRQALAYWRFDSSGPRSQRRLRTSRRRHADPKRPLRREQMSSRETCDSSLVSPAGQKVHLIRKGIK